MMLGLCPHAMIGDSGDRAALAGNSIEFPAAATGLLGLVLDPLLEIGLH